jgi:anti-sigma factor RsiW
MSDERDIGHDIPLLADSGREPGRDCADEAVLAAYAESMLDNGEREALEDHLADCSWCLGQIGFLIRETDSELPAVPTELLEAARGRRRSRWFGRPSAPTWAALAAAAIMIIGATAVLQVNRAPDGTFSGAPAAPTSEAASDRTVRNGGIAHALDVIEPKEDVELSSSGLEVRWRPSPQALQYTVLLVSLDGDLLWEGSTADTRIAIPSAAVAPGERYFVWIEARLPGGGTLKSNAVGFHTAPE